MARTGDRGNNSSALAYFSHSYREADRDVNLFFWSLFSDQGFFFTVDPHSQFFSIPYLESMMRFSNCFVAVITKREGAPAGCSPYILFEYGLAVQGQKPSLVFVEQGLSGEFFPRDPERVVPFNRNRLPAQKTEFLAGIEALAEKVRGYRNPDLRLLEPAGLVVKSGPEADRVYTPELIQTLKSAMLKCERRLEIVKLDFGASFEVCLELDKYDFLLMELQDCLQVPWLTGYVLGRAVPSIKLCHLDAGETPLTAPLPAIVARHVPEHTDEVPVTYWHTPDELLKGVVAHVAKFGTERIEFHSKAAGQRYFRRAGRRGGKVFISNASASGTLVRRLITTLRFESIDFFHYQVKDAIPAGERWLPELERQIEQSGIFLAIITDEFMQSRWCLYELQVALSRQAEGRIEVMAFVLAPHLFNNLTVLGLSDIQVVDLSSTDEKQTVLAMLKAVDRSLKRDRPAPQKSAPPAGPRSTRVLTEEQRAALVEIVAERLTTEDSAHRPVWIKGLLMRALLYAPLAGEDYGGNAQAAAVTLVEKVEALGVLPDGGYALVQFVSALGPLVTHAHEPFLSTLATSIAASRAGD